MKQRPRETTFEDFVLRMNVDQRRRIFEIVFDEPFCLKIHFDHRLSRWKCFTDLFSTKSQTTCVFESLWIWFFPLVDEQLSVSEGKINEFLVKRNTQPTSTVEWDRRDE